MLGTVGGKPRSDWKDYWTTDMATSKSYNLNGPTEFPFPYPVRTADDLVLNLSLGGTVPPSSYEVVGTGANSIGVTVRYPSAPTDGTQSLTVSRITPIEAVSDFTSDQAVTARALNDEIENIYRAITDNSIALGFDPPVVWQPGLYAVSLKTTVIYQNALYYAIVTHTTGQTFEPEKWQFITYLTDLIQGMLMQELVASMPYGIPAVDPLFVFTSVHAIDVDNTFALWVGYALTPSTANTTLTMVINSTTIGTVTFQAGQNTPTFLSTGTPPPRHELFPGDRFILYGPSTADATLAGVSLTMPWNMVVL